MTIAFTELPYYQDFVLTDDLARRAQIVRDYCQVLLMTSDWTVLQYSPTDTLAWKHYRDQVRAFADSYDPTDTNPIFPVKPEIVRVEVIGDTNGN